MVYENIKFYKPNMAVRDSFFYLFDYSQRILTQKRADGGISFQFPVTISSSFTNYAVGEVICLHFDGYNFWTLQLFTDNSGALIRRWLITNFICKLILQFPKINTPSNKYSISTFAVESYNTKLSADFFSGSTYIIIDEYTDSVIYEGTTIGIVNEKYGSKELVTVQYVEDNYIYLTSPIIADFYSGDNITITPALFLFNNYYLLDSSKGSLIMIDPNTGADLSYKVDIEFLGITAAKFCRLNGVLQNFPDVHTLAYVKSTNLKLRNMDDLYRYKATLKGSDNFDAADLSLPNNDRWLIDKGDPIIFDNKLLCTVAGIGHDKILSIYNATGNFSVQVSGTCSGISTYSGVDIDYKSQHYIGITCGTTNYSFGFDYSNIIWEYKDIYLHLKMNGNALDSVGTYNGTLYNSPTLVTGYDGTPNGAYSFNGSSYIQIAGATALELGKNNADFSLVFWLKLNSNYNGSYRSITHKGTADAQRTFAIWHRPESNRLHVRLTTTSDANFGADTITELPINTWFLFSYVKAGNTLSVYTNDVLDNKTTFVGSTVSNVGPIYIGDTPWYTGASTSIDNYTIFNRAITAEEVKFIYNKDIKFMVRDTLPLPQFSTYVDNYKYFTTLTPSGIDFPFNYLLKAERVTNTLDFYYNTLISGTEQGWLKAASFMLPSVDCGLSLGLAASMVTTSGCYFDDLVFNSGYLVYRSSELPYYGTMGMDNVKVNQSTVLPIYAIDIEGDNLYRLQNQGTYFGTDYTWSTYNFQISPIRSFIDFITVDSDTHILPATGRNTAIVRSIVYDQYGQGVVDRPVEFIDDDTMGFITRPIVHTDTFYNTGVANTAYTSGTSLRVVNITGTVTQLD